MTWIYPISGWDTYGTPVGDHPGAFGVRRKHNIHEGVDIYCDDGARVRAVEDGVVSNICWFTGPFAGSPWWRPTMAVMVEGATGLVVYGEVSHVRPGNIDVGAQVRAGQHIGYVTRVLKKDKGKPTSMLHIELRAHGHTESSVWELDQPKPDWLLDPTPYLLETR